MSYLRLLQYSAERRTRYLFTAVCLRQFRLSMKAKSIFYDAECNQSCFVAIARKELNSIDEEPKSWLHDLFLSSTAVNSKSSWTPSFKGIINTCQIPSIELRLVVMSRRMNECYRLTNCALHCGGHMTSHCKVFFDVNLDQFISPSPLAII